MDDLIVYGALALLVPVGLIVYMAGVTRAKNSAGAVLRGFGALCTAILVAWAVGIAIWAQQHNGVIGVDRETLMSDVGPRGMFLIILLAIPALVAIGALGERSQFFPLLAVSTVLAGFVVPVAGKWAWEGWLKRMGFVDAAGATWLHLSAGIFAAVGAAFVGPRQGKFHRDGSTSVIPGHSLPLAGIGVLLLTVGWIAYVGGAVLFTGRRSEAGHAGLGVILCAAAGGLSSLLYGQFRYNKPDVLLTLIGMMGALVASTAGAATMPTSAAALTGAIAGVLVAYAATRIDVRARLDDPASAIAIHAVGGAWGALAQGVFGVAAAGTGSFQMRYQHVLVQLLGIFTIAAFAAACAVALFAGLKTFTRLRATEADEYDGLDLAQHDVGAYPDFQQNTIRSYHLRET